MRKSFEHMKKYETEMPQWLLDSRRKNGTETERKNSPEFFLLGAYHIHLDGSNQKFQVIASIDGGEWEHVSASIISSDRIPKWSEMCQIKDMFFEDNEYVVQFHPAKKDYVNLKSNVLHLWRNRYHPLRIPDSADGKPFDRTEIYESDELHHKLIPEAHMGAGKYDDLCTYVRTEAKAQGAIIHVIGGEHGDGFSVQSTDLSLNFVLPKMLRDLADAIEKTLAVKKNI